MTGQTGRDRALRQLRVSSLSPSRIQNPLCGTAWGTGKRYQKFEETQDRMILVST